MDSQDTRNTELQPTTSSTPADTSVPANTLMQPIPTTDTASPIVASADTSPQPISMSPANTSTNGVGQPPKRHRKRTYTLLIVGLVCLLVLVGALLRTASNKQPVANSHQPSRSSPTIAPTTSSALQTIQSSVSSINASNSKANGYLTSAQASLNDQSTLTSVP